MKKKVLIAALVLGGALLLQTCRVNNLGFLASIGIEDAKSLAIVSGEEGNTLVKVTAQDQVEDVPYLNERGNPVEFSEEPIAAHDVDGDYLILLFGYEDNPQAGYLTRKSDGAVFSLEEVGYPSGYWGHFANVPRVQVDGAGRFYYQVWSSETEMNSVIRIDPTDPAHLTATTMTTDLEDTIAFTVTPEGHLAYAYGDGSDHRVKKSNGGLYNMPSMSWLPFWVGTDGDLKYQMDDNPGVVQTVSIDPVTYEVTLVPSNTGADVPWVQSYDSYLVTLADRTLLVGVLNGVVAEVENPADTPRAVTLTGIDEISTVAVSDLYYYLGGTDASLDPVLLRVDPTDDSVTTLLPSGDLLCEVYNLAVTPDDVVTFTGLRMSDGIKIIGVISAAGVVTVIDEESDYDVVVLERLR